MTMDIRSAIKGATMAASAASTEIELSGWIVIIDNDLYILDENLPEDYKQAPKIRLADRGIIYALYGAILPLGGDSFVFHRAKVVGVLHTGISLELIVSSLFIQERGTDEYVAIDVTAQAISAGKARYEATLSFDFFKEMGDT